MSKVWITRTQPGAGKTAERLTDIGFEPVISPLLKVVPPKTMPGIPDKDCLLVFTSKNGVRAFCACTDKRHWPVVTVGDATAALAKDFGFEDVMSASGTAKDVIELIKSSLKKSTPILHCAGEMIRGDIVDRLAFAGFKARRDIYYGTEPIPLAPDDLDGISYVLLHSPLAAKTLRNLSVDISHVTAVSISEAANAELDALALRETRVANAPTETALLACLQG